MNRFFSKTKTAVFQSVTAIVCAAVLITSVSSCGMPVEVTPSPSASDAEAEPSAAAATAGKADNKFTVRYRSDRSLNPITGTDPNNMVLAPLLYEGLFVLNSRSEAENVLCEEYSTSNGINYTFKLKAGIAMSDGSNLTSTDVKYTLNNARQSGRFSGRLKIIDGISTPDSLTVTITLKYANYKFPQILDVPIIKYNSIDQNHPAGSGPYYYKVSDETPTLQALDGYRYAVPIQVIYLKDVTNEELSIDFSSQEVDFFWDDPADASDIRILSDHEVRYYDTTVLEFIGFNARTNVLSNPDIRRALGLSLDRAAIVDQVYLNHADEAPLVLSPNYRLYDPDWEPQVTDALGDISAIFHDLGMDTAFDGYLGIPDGTGNIATINLRLVYNKENSFKVQVAQMVAEAIKSVGIAVTLVPLSWSSYMTALQNGSFDLYIGDVTLPADYDLTALLAARGSLDYGRTGDASYVAHIGAFLTATDDTAETEAAKSLCDYIYQQAPIVPILYRQYAVHSNRNVIINFDPTQSSLFYGFVRWKINLG